MANRPTALGCYVFAGGFAWGVRKHFDIQAHFEDGSYGVETAAHNIPELRGRIFTDPGSWPTSDYAGRVDFVYGNPPCAPWSVCAAGRKIPWRLDPRVACTNKLYALLDSIQPKVWAFESVRPTFTKGRELIDEMVSHAQDRGYTATALMVDGINHAVPQRRPRFFLVLSRYEIPWEPSREKKIVTVGEAFAKPFKTTTAHQFRLKFYLDLVKKCPQGVRLAKVFGEEYPERVLKAETSGEKCVGRPSFQIMRLAEDQPSCTLTGGPNQIHPRLIRCISIEESAVLCGYPRSFVFKGPIGKQYAQVAQAVMPPVAEYLARHVAKALEIRAKPPRLRFERVNVGMSEIEVKPLGVQASLSLIPKEFTTHLKEEKKMPNPTIDCPTCRGTGKILAPASLVPKLERTKTAVPKIAKNPVMGRVGRITEPSKPQSMTTSGEKGSGYRIRELLVTGKLSTEQILTKIHQEFPGSKAKQSDVAWNKRKLAQQGGAP